MCSTSTPTSRPIVTAHAIRPSVCEMLKRRSGDAGGTIENLGTAVHVGDELPVRGRDRRVSRQHRAHQRAREQERAAIAIEDQPRHPLVLVLPTATAGTTSSLSSAAGLAVCDQVDVHGVEGQDVHR